MSKEELKIPFDAQLSIAKAYEEGNNWYVEGYAATTDYDDQGDIITEQALKQSENDLLERSTVLFNHDSQRPIGKVETANADGKGLKVKVLISKTEPDIWQKIKEGVINKFSIRGSILESVKEKVKQAGKEIWANIIKAMKLVEVSLVSVPANSQARTLAWYMSKALEDNKPMNKICDVCGVVSSEEICNDCNAEIVKAVWDTAYVNDLPDSCFAYISPGGKKVNGKTEPRSLRHLPYKDKDGKPDAAHVRNALARLNQTNIPASAKAMAKRRLMMAARGMGMQVSAKSFTFDEVDALMKEIEELKGYTVVNGVMQPMSRMRAYATHMKGLTDCKLGKIVNISASGSIKSLESDEDYGDTCLIDINKGELTEVAKSMADIKKKDGTLYSQEEIDSLVAKSESTEKELSDMKVASETEKATTKKSMDDVNAKVVDVETKLADVTKELATAKSELDVAKAKQVDEDINKKVDAKWAEFEGKAYKKEDAAVIKAILKKGFLGQALTPEETDSLISKKIQGSILKLGFDAVSQSGTMTKERREQLIALGGIKIKAEKK